MIRISLRDLQWRRRRFVIVVLVASLAFGLALVMSGVTNQMTQEGRTTVSLFGADQWVVADGVSGPFTSSQLIDRRLADTLAGQPGVTAASPILIGRTSVGERDVNIVGYDPASPMLPPKLAHALEDSGGRAGAIADVALDRSIGEEVRLGGETLPVVALVRNTSFFFSAPTVFLPLHTVQRLLFAGQDVASAVMIRGQLDPSGSWVEVQPADVLTNADVRADFDRVLKSSTETIGIINVLLWLMAAGIVAAIVYVSVLERTRDFATLKALGTTNRALFGGLVAQAAVISFAGAVASVAVCQAISPTFSFPVTVPSTAYVQLVVVAMFVGALASLAGVRKITRIDPALAFGGAS
jgi:putative ABC transport system permease protein